MKRMACVFALAAGTGLGLTAVTAPALAEPGLSAKASGLQLAISSTSTSGDDAIVLGVNYRGGQIEGIALYIDGALVKTRALATRTTHGTIRFELEPTLLSEGEHEVVIKATDPEGNTATATTQLRIASADLVGPVRLLFPRKNASVQGVVPIEVQLDSAIRKPFVSFFVDNDFLELTNFAPFTYNWDSAKSTNGAHTISVDVMDGETQAKIKSISIHVTVNNPGGLTNRQAVTPDLRPRTSTPLRQIRSTIAKAVTATAPVSNFEAPNLNVSLPEIANSPVGDLRASDVNPSDLIPMESVAVAFLNRPDANRPDAVGRPSALGAPDHTTAPSGFRMAPVARPGALALFATPSALLQFHRELLSSRLPTGVLARPKRAGNFAAIPGLDVTAYVPHLAPIALLHRDGLPVSGAFRNVGNHGLQIAFDNTMLAFDVAPRVEHELPLAPFRQIFEHTGGVVQWFGHSHTVRAINSSREIQFRIGHSQATVNNHVVSMQARPYIDRGRAIVPLSFVRDALNVTVHYDPSTGHLRIDSRK